MASHHLTLWCIAINLVLFLGNGYPSPYLLTIPPGGMILGRLYFIIFSKQLWCAITYKVMDTHNMMKVLILPEKCRSSPDHISHASYEHDEWSNAYSQNIVVI